MISPAFNLTSTERVLPKLALDFTTASLDGRVTFTRTTSASNPATFVNSSGVITAATDNQPRFDYDPVTLACKGLLVEESRTNHMPYSSDFNSWSKTNVTVSPDVAVSPDGTANADLVYPNAASSALYGVRVSRTIGGLSSAQYTNSVYVKYSGWQWIYITDASGTLHGWFDVKNGAIGVTGGNTLTINSAGNGWYRVTVARAVNAVLTYFYINFADANNSTNVTPNGTNGVYLYGAQTEPGAFATSYIPTTTTALTRNADVATMTGTNLTDWCDTTKGTILSQQAVAQFNAANTIYAYSLGSAAAVEVYAGMSTAGANQFTVVNTTNQANFAGFSAGTLNTPQKVCGYYQANKFAASANGIAGGTDVSGTVPTINKLVFGARNDGARVLNGWIQKFSYWPFTLTTSEVTAFSK